MMPFDDVFSGNKGLDKPAILMGEFNIDGENGDICDTKKIYIDSSQDKWLLIVLYLGLTYPKDKAILDPACDAWYAQPTEV